MIIATWTIQRPVKITFNGPVLSDQYPVGIAPKPKKNVRSEAKRNESRQERSNPPLLEDINGSSGTIASMTIWV